MMTFSVEKLLRGQYFYTGARIALGLLLLSLGVYFVGGTAIAATVVSGAMCTSMGDVTSPLRHKPRELLASWLLSALMYLLILTLRPMPWVLGFSVLALSFLIALSAVYGKKAGPVSFAATFAIIMALGSATHNPDQLLEAGLYFFAGGFFYFLYGVLAARLLSFRSKQQVFAECAFELGQFLRIKAACYEKDAALDSLYLLMVQQQAVVVGKQQSAREFLFRDMRGTRDIRLAGLFIMQIDLFEYIIASNTDYSQLQEHYSGNDTMMFLRDLVEKIAQDVDETAFAALRNASIPFHIVNYKAELFAIEHDLERMSHDRTQDISALTILIDAFDKIALCAEKIEKIREMHNDPACSPDPTLSLKLSLFTTSTDYSPYMVLKHLSLRSPHFRYALRAAIAMGCGFFVAHALGLMAPSSGTHGYWILLTISVVLRSNFSMTLQRRTDRIIGNTCGCLFMAVLMYFSPPAALLLFLWLVAQILVNTFVFINYRYAAACASILALIQIHFLNPSVSFAFGERIIDTILGSLIAYVCSFIFPNWEYRSIPNLITALGQANTRYIQAVFGCAATDEAYRLARKDLFDATAELSGAFSRMLGEPKNKRRAVQETGRFITLNHLFGARVASMRVLLSKLSEYPTHTFPESELAAVKASVRQFFVVARAAWQEPGQGQALGEVCFPIRNASSPPTISGEARGIRFSANTPAMDYSAQNVMAQLQKQLDAAFALAREIQELEKMVGKAL